jgi:hypothetical protein
MTKVSDLPTLVDHTDSTRILSSTFANEAGSRFLVLEHATKVIADSSIAAVRIIG